MRKPISTDKAPLAGGPYSQAIVHNGVAYIAGQGSFTPGTRDFAPGDFRQQAELTLSNIGAILEACGSSFEHVLSVRVFLKSRADFAELNQIYLRYFSEPFPARTTIQAELPKEEMLIEIDCVAAIP